jgi:hypothetical protein
LKYDKVVNLNIEYLYMYETPFEEGKTEEVWAKQKARKINISFQKLGNSLIQLHGLHLYRPITCILTSN